ncbi:cold-shock protein [Bradyrhizobium australafricanum]|uniref:cold-shock protein n=1 Tax=Bradyrhizobium australafricanum TaxID=2821406 RepID=UPI001CE3A170|nr:cold-shock protein [Bradyrhizobium australafricanum]
MGIVKWFNSSKGYAFIRPEDGSADVFVHISAVEKAGYTTLKGARVSYELRPGAEARRQLRIFGLVDEVRLRAAPCNV